MRYLLDSHTLLWFDGSPEKLSKKVLKILLDKENELYLSHASLWEMQIKQQLGKLKLETEMERLIDSQCQTNDIQLLNMEPEHIYGLQALPSHHRDPFDRMLISQAMIEDMTLISIDEKIQLYQPQINCLW